MAVLEKYTYSEDQIIKCRDILKNRQVKWGDFNPSHWREIHDGPTTIILEGVGFTASVKRFLGLVHIGVRVGTGQWVVLTQLSRYRLGIESLIPDPLAEQVAMKELCNHWLTHTLVVPDP